MRAHETRAVGIAHRPDAPRALASMRTLSGEDELLDATIDEIETSIGGRLRTCPSPTTGASRAEVHRAALLHVDPGLVAVASTSCVQLRVDARRVGQPAGGEGFTTG